MAKFVTKNFNDKISVTESYFSTSAQTPSHYGKNIAKLIGKIDAPYGKQK